MKQHFDAAVIGAGYIGCAVAYYLSLAGLKTAIFDQGSIAFAASGANFGNIQIQDLELEKSVELTLQGQACFETLEEELDWKLNYRKIGSLLPIENERQYSLMNERCIALNRWEVLAEMVSAQQLREIEPFINSDILLGGLYHPSEGQIDPFQLMRAFISRGCQNGLKLFFNTKITGFSINNHKITGLESSQGCFSSEYVIFCTGAFTAQLGHLLHQSWPVHYILGQALVTEPCPLILHNHLSSASFFEPSTNIQKGNLITNMAISQTSHGNIMTGETMLETDHFSKMLPAATLPLISRCWLRYFPDLQKLRVLRSWSAPVADVPDGLPLLGPIENIDGAYIATAFRSTVVVTPLIGKIITQLITKVRSELDISAFLPERIIHEQN